MNKPTEPTNLPAWDIESRRFASPHPAQLRLPGGTFTCLRHVDGCPPEPAQRPDPTKTGPCELKLSFACTGAGYERLDPRDMLKPETSFRTPVISCVECNDMAADYYLKELHS